MIKVDADKYPLMVLVTNHIEELRKITYGSKPEVSKGGCPTKNSFLNRIESNEGYIVHPNKGVPILNPNLPIPATDSNCEGKVGD